MKPISQVALILLSVLLLNGCSLFLSKYQRAEWMPLFEDEEKWQIIGESEWQIDDGIISPVGYQGQGFLVSDQKYKSFELSLEFLPDDIINSGVFIRCQSLDFTLETAYEINIADAHENPDFRTGSIVTHAVPKQPITTTNKWNLYEIKANGDKLDVRINGTKMANFNEASLDAGYIALQRLDEGMIKFKNIKIKTW